MSTVHLVRQQTRSDRGFLDATPMMMVPVFVIVITFFAFTAVRNEMLKDDINDIDAEIRAKQAQLENFREERPKKIANARVDIVRTSTSRRGNKEKNRKETLSYIEKQAEMEKRLAVAAARLQKKESIVEELRDVVDELQGEIEELRGEHRRQRRANRTTGRRGRDRDRWREGEEPEPPYYSLFRAAEADNARVLRRFNLAVTQDDVDPIRAVRTEVWFKIEAPWYLLDVPRMMLLLVGDYYGRVAEIDNWEGHDERWQTYLNCKDEHDDLRDLRSNWLKDLKKTCEELEKIEKTTNRRVKAAGYTQVYVSPYLEYLEGARKDLRKIDVKPPAEPKKRIGTTSRPRWR